MVSYTVVFLSDTAWDGLIQKGGEFGYIRGDTRAKGMALFLRRVLAFNKTAECWTDTRPDYIKQQTLDELEVGLIPTWDLGELRKKRLIGIAPEDFDSWSDLAYILGVVKSNEKRPGRGARFSNQSLRSQILEAFGLGWLTPRQIPQHEYKTRAKAYDNRVQGLNW